MRIFSKIHSTTTQSLRNSDGSTNVDYAALLALVCRILAASIHSLGTENAKVLTDLSDFLQAAAEEPTQIKRPSQW